MGQEGNVTLGSRLRLLASEGSYGNITVTLNQWRVLSQVPSCQRVGQICVRLGMRPDLVLRIVEELLAKDLIRIEMMQPSVGIVALPESHSRRHERRSA